MFQRMSKSLLTSSFPQYSSEAKVERVPWTAFLRINGFTATVEEGHGLFHELCPSLSQSRAELQWKPFLIRN